jgi:hypothetical protein
MLNKNGVKTEPKNDIIKNEKTITNEKIIVSSLLNIFFKKLFTCSNISGVSFVTNIELWLDIYSQSLHI